MRVLMITGDYPPMLSGIGDYTHHLVQSLRYLNCEIKVLTAKGRGSEAEAARLIETWDEKSLPAIEGQIRNWSPDILHIQYMTSCFNNHPFINFLPGKIKQKFHEIKIVTTYHEFASPWKRLAVLGLLWGSDADIVTNDDHQRKLKTLKRIAFARGFSWRIPLAANIPRVNEEAMNRLRVRQEMGVRDDETLLVRFGIIHDISAPEIINVLEVLRELRLQGEKIKLLLVGKEESQAKAKITGEIESKKLQNAVILKTNLSAAEISRYLSASDIGLALYPDGVSEKRTAFLSLFEHGLPVIATQKGTLSSELKDGGNILCVPVKFDQNLWIEAVKKLVRDTEFRNQLIAGGTKTAEAHNWESIGQATFDLYRRVMES